MKKPEIKIATAGTLVGLLLQVNPGDIYNEVLYYYINDHLGTPQLMVDHEGLVVWRADYDPFGAASVDPGSSTINQHRFPGQYQDEETQLHYNYFRDYDPRTGRYLTPDPIRLIGGINLYPYVENNPVNAIDPYGLIVHYNGNPEEIALMHSWMDKLKECAKCDEDLKKRISEVENGAYHFYVSFKEGFTAGGFTSPDVRLAPVLKNPEQDNFYYHAVRSNTDNRGIGYFRGPDVLAHELLGHGYDRAIGDQHNNQGKAIDIENKIRKCLGNYQPQRSKLYD